MKKTARPAATPPERRDTVRHEIMTLLERGTFSAHEISAETGISERDVYIHLEHIQRSLSRQTRHLTIAPAECRHCGFLFRKRERLKPPGRCPVCKSEHIQDPLFSVKGAAR